MFKISNSTTMNGLAVADALAFAAFVSSQASAAPVSGAALAHAGGLEPPAGKVTKAHIRVRGFRPLKILPQKVRPWPWFQQPWLRFRPLWALWRPYSYRGYGLNRSYGYPGYGFHHGFGRDPVSGGR